MIVIRSFVIELFVISIYNLQSATVHGFGLDGHRVVADMAWWLLSDDCKDEIYDLLDEEWFWYQFEMQTRCYSFEKCNTLGKVAEWADDVRKTAGVVHNIAIPDAGNDCLAPDAYKNNPNCRLDYARDCENDKCVVGEIVKQTLALQHYMEDRKRNRQLFLLGGMVWDFLVGVWDRLFGESSIDKTLEDFLSDYEREALMFLTHLMGDLHQPLHAGRQTDNGGSLKRVTFMNVYNEASLWRWLCGDYLPSFIFNFFSCGINLHGVWDYGIVTKTIQEDFDGNRRALEDDLWYEFLEDNNEETSSWLSCLPTDNSTTLDKAILQSCVMEWANESLVLALQHAYLNVDGVEIAAGTDLTEAYHQKSLPVVRKQLAKGAVRFAALLERVLVLVPASE